jgi:hypothetical protein
MHVEAWMLGQPGFDLGMLVCGVVVGDQMKGQTGGSFALDRLQEGEPLLVSVTPGDPADQFAIE